jgi:hypothetical protein
MMRFYQTSESGDNGEVSRLKNKFLAFMEKLEKQERATHRTKEEPFFAPSNSRRVTPTLRTLFGL